MYNDIEIKGIVYELIREKIEDSGVDESEFINKCIRELLLDEYRLSAAIRLDVDILQNQLDLHREELDELLEKERILNARRDQLLRKYYDIKVERCNESSLDEITADAVESVKGIIERTDGNIDMNMINYNARKCHRSLYDFMNILDKENVKI